jgi:hypothetical protein
MSTKVDSESLGIAIGGWPRGAHRSTRLSGFYTMSEGPWWRGKESGNVGRSGARGEGGGIGTSRVPWPPPVIGQHRSCLSPACQGKG